MEKIDIGKKIISANEEYAAMNRKAAAGRLLVNIISSPGSGKTSILERTIPAICGKFRVGVIEGDIQTELDADRIRATGVAVHQVNTRGSCHLSARQVSEGIEKLGPGGFDIIFIENVGNLVCPSAFDLGESAKVVVLSAAEGDDKPEKYPQIFSRSAVMLLNKLDLLDAGCVEFDAARASAAARKLNPVISIFGISARTGAGFEPWLDWLSEAALKCRAGAAQDR